ncbi:cyclin-domain-containing protein [Phascolomyces articulosus]|uniref:Cyclin-domain-containing protein n=1 Tax=Phascolomyces articulosus TaxID=60185 RepID=A0AAD5KJJ5_9FUNG|nr:cyclin-domain-containing protein [Phascolomyces articulosus]
MNTTEFNVAQPTVTPINMNNIDTTTALLAAAHSIGTHQQQLPFLENDLHKYSTSTSSSSSSSSSSTSLLSLLLNSTMPHLTSTLSSKQPTSTTTQLPQQQHDIITKQKQYQEKQRAYVNALVDVTVQAIASIWPNATSTPSSNQRPIANLNTFLHHILKHSRTTHSTLQLAIFYLFRIRPRVLERRNDDVYISCGRRMFLAALICAHKFLQDKTYKNSAWSKVSGLGVNEVNHAERVMLQLLDWSLYVKKDTYDQWIFMLQNHLKFRVPSSSTTTITSTTNEHPLEHIMEWHKPKIPFTQQQQQQQQSTTTTNIHLGMPTPVEEVASIKHALPCKVSLLSSPPERKRKAMDCLSQMTTAPTKRRLA